MDKCGVCGRPDCQEEWFKTVMVIGSEQFRHRDDDPVTGWVAVERIYGQELKPGAKNPSTFLRYAPGDSVPESEARALGKAVRRVDDKAVTEADDKAVKPSQVKTKKG